MTSNSKLEYIKTDLTKIIKSPEIKENSFISIIDLYNNIKNNIISDDKAYNNNNQKNISKKEININQEPIQNNIQKKNDSIQDSDLDISMEDRSKTVEISASGNVQIKNNKFFENKNNINFKLEDNNNILDYDDKAEDIFMNNNPFPINNSSNNSKNKININIKNENNSEFMLQDIPFNINSDEFRNKWKKLYFLYMEKNNNLKKKNYFDILEGLINSRRNNKKKHKIEELVINYNNLKESDKNKNIKNINAININNNDINIKYSSKTNKNNIRDSTDSRASFENLTNIITTTQINNLSNSSDLKNTINNINININNAKVIIPSLSKFNDESESIFPMQNNNYQKTDISHILSANTILNPEKFKNVIDFVKYKDDLFTQKINNSNSSNVLVNLDSGVKTKEYENIFTIKEEENESYDSLSIQKSGKVTPNKLDLKKNSYKDMKDNNQNNINNSLSNNFINEELTKKINIIKEVNIGNEEEEKDEKFNDNEINVNINNSSNNIDYNKENKIMSIDIYMNNDSKKNYDIKSNNKEDNNDMEISKEKYVDEKNEEKEEEEGEGEEDEKDNIEEKDKDNVEEKDKLNYTTPESKEKTIEKKYENVKDEMNKKNGQKELNSFEIDKNDKLQFSDFNEFMNSGERSKVELLSNSSKKGINKRIIIKDDENLDNRDTYKKININNGKDDDLKIESKKSENNTEEKILLSESKIKNVLKDSFFNHHLKSPESSLIDFNKENEDKGKNKIFDVKSNRQSSFSKKSRKEDLIKEFLHYYIVNNNNNYKIIISKNKNIINNKIYSISLQSYLNILKFLNLKLTPEKKYAFFIIKLEKKLEKYKMNNNSNIISNDIDNENIINSKIEEFENKLKLLKQYYLNVFNKKGDLKKKKDFNNDIVNKEEMDINRAFGNLILLIHNKNIVNSHDKYSIYIQKIKKILKKYESLKSEEVLPKIIVKEKGNKIDFSIKEHSNKNEQKNNNAFKALNNDLIKPMNKRLPILISLLVPLYYLYNFINTYSKNFNI